MCVCIERKRERRERERERARDRERATKSEQERERKRKREEFLPGARAEKCGNVACRYADSSAVPTQTYKTCQQ